MAGSRKKAIVRLHTGETHAAHIVASGFVRHSAAEWLDLEGRTVATPLADLRWIAYVRDWNLGEPDPERLTRTVFLARPRVEGLWVRIGFMGATPGFMGTAPGRPAILEGLAPLDLGLVSGVAEDDGLMLLPPDARANTQRLYVPRLAMATLQVLGVITSPSRRPAVPKPTRGARPVSGNLFADVPDA